jgi:integrase
MSFSIAEFERELIRDYDPDRPAEGWRYALREMLTAANIRVSAYTFRHHAITELLENPDVSEQSAESIAGHISECMKKRYSHTRLEVKRAAVEALERIAPGPTRPPTKRKASPLRCSALKPTHRSC